MQKNIQNITTYFDVFNIYCIIMNANKNAAVCIRYTKPYTVVEATFKISRACWVIIRITISFSKITRIGRSTTAIIPIDGSASCRISQMMSNTMNLFRVSGDVISNVLEIFRIMMDISLYNRQILKLCDTVHSSSNDFLRKHYRMQKQMGCFNLLHTRNWEKSTESS